MRSRAVAYTILTAVLAAAAAAEQFAVRPITIVNPFPPGGQPF